MPNLLKVALVANIFEFYEFSIYAYLANIIGQSFFGVDDSIIGLIKAFSVFAIGYLARPLGSFFFGIMGDRVGRGAPLKMVLLLMAVPTALIGVLPTYQDIGLLAPVLLLALRLIQGFAMGAELPVTACYIFEAAPPDRRSVLCSIVMTSELLGVLLASLIVTLLFWYFDRDTILAGAWRIPFLLSIPLTIVIGYIRRVIDDLPVPRTQSHELVSHDLKWSLFGAVLLALFAIIFFYVLVIWMPFYLTHFLNYPPQLARLTNTVVLAASVIFFFLAGYIAHSVGYQRLIKIDVTTTIILIYPIWLGLQHASFGVVLTMQLVLAVLLGGINGVLMEMLAKHFSPAMRCRGMNLTFTLPAVFLGGTTPLICTWVINKTGWLMFPAFYILFFGLLALPAAWRLKPAETSWG